MRVVFEIFTTPDVFDLLKKSMNKPEFAGLTIS